MQPEPLNPHVINSLLCLIGIVFCLVLIGWGIYTDRRAAQEDEPAEPNLTMNESRLPYRQVA